MSVAMEQLKRHALLLVLLAGIGASYCVWSSSPALGDLFGDGSNYLMLAGHLSFYGHWDAVHDAMGRDSRFPPGYPLLLAVFDASMNLQRAHVITSLCLLPALAMFYRWLLEQGCSRSEAALLVLLIALLPQTWRQGLRIQSEFQYLFLSLLALWLLERFRQSRNRGHLLLASTAVSASILTREVGLALLIPLLLCVRGMPWRSKALAFGIAILPAIDWHVLHPAPVTYGGILGETYGAGFVRQLGRQLATELPALRMGFSTALWNGDSPLPLADVVAALCLVGTAGRLCMLKLDAIYIAANLAILLIWPYPEEAARFLWVLLPLALAQPALLVAAIIGKEPFELLPRAVLGFVSAAVLLMALPGLFFAVSRFREGAASSIPDASAYLTWYEGELRFSLYDAGAQAAITDLLARAQAIIPVNDCLLAPRIDMAAYLARRRSFYWPAPDVPDAEFDRRIEASGCSYALVYRLEDRRYPIPMYPLDRIKGRASVLLEGWLPRTRAARRRPVCLLLKLHPASEGGPAGEDSSNRGS